MHSSGVLLLVAASLGQAPDVPPLFKEYSQRVMHYYESPDAALGPRMLRDFLKKENVAHPWFEKNEHVLVLIGAQLGDIALGKARIVRAYEAELAGAPLRGRRVILRALTVCGDRETRKQVDAWLSDRRYADVRPELEALKKHLEDPKRKQVRDRPARTPDDLDLLWGNFFITGEYAPVGRILDVFDDPKTRDNAVLVRVARWSLGSNLQQHPKLVALVQKHARERSERSRKVIGELIITRPQGP